MVIYSSLSPATSATACLSAAEFFFHAKMALVAWSREELEAKISSAEWGTKLSKLFADASARDAGCWSRQRWLILGSKPRLMEPVLIVIYDHPY